jgi:RNA polymerase sigma-70 factor (ECF subfamily)
VWYFLIVADKDKYIDNNEKELMALLAAGDPTAFGQLFDSYYNKVLSQVLTFQKSYAAAEDATQDIFLKLWSRREKLAGVSSLRDYLFILTRNEMIDHLRVKAVQLSTGHEALPLISEDILVPDQQLDYRETYQLILKGVAELPPQQQQVFRMSRLEGKSNGEIAQSLGIAKTTVRWHITLALNFLRVYVARHIGPFLLAGPFFKKFF